jgi:hypothetical protein
MSFLEDIRQIRINNSSFGDPKFSVSVDSTYLIFLFERARKTTGSVRVLFFFINSSFSSGIKG